VSTSEIAHELEKLYQSCTKETLLDIESKTQDGVRIVKLRGRLCMGAPLDQFNATMAELLNQPQPKIILDLSDVATIDSSAIGMLVRCLTTAKKAGGSIRLLNPTKFTLQTLKMVGLLNLFATYEDLSQAIASFQ
jgi:anti-sigma B factor antagonist